MKRTGTALATLLMSVGVFAAPAQAAGPAVKIDRVHATPSAYTGACPSTTEFTARVTVRGATKLTYRWLREDGTRTRAVTVPVKGGSALVRDRRTFSDDTKGWQALQVLKPRRATSARTRFTVACEHAPSGGVAGTGLVSTAPPGATVAAPAPYSGACPLPGHQVTFTGTVTGGATRYRWVDSDGGPQPAELLTSGTKVTSTRTFLASQAGTRWLETLDDSGRVTARSNRAAYRVTCTAPRPQEPAKVTVTEPRVTPASHVGACDKPLEFVFTAGLAATKPAKVAYRWIRSDGTQQAGEVTLKGDLTTTLRHTFTVADPSKLERGWARVHLLTPASASTGPATFTITCQDSPITLGQTGVSSRSSAPGPCDTTRNPYWFTASVQVRAAKPMDVSYQWRWSDGGFTRPVTATVDGTRTLSHTWASRASKTAEVWLEVLTPVQAKSRPGSFSVICDGKPPTDAGGSVIQVANPKVTPSQYTGACPATLRFTVDITVSGPLKEPVTYTWYLDDNRSFGVQRLEFPEGGPFTRTAEVVHRPTGSTGRPVTGYVEVFTPNTVFSAPVSFQVTCS